MAERCTFCGEATPGIVLLLGLKMKCPVCNGPYTPQNCSCLLHQRMRGEIDWYLDADGNVVRDRPIQEPSCSSDASGAGS